MSSWKNNGSFDGIHVDLYDGRFTGSFEIDDETAQSVACDDVVYVLCAATVSGASIKIMKNDELKRTNVLKVDGAKILTADEGIACLRAAKLKGLYGGAEPSDNADEDQPNLFYEDEETFNDIPVAVTEQVEQAKKHDAALDNFLYGSSV